jgi:hypothetical protein
LVAFSRGKFINDNGEESGFSFVQLKAISEQTDKPFIVGNYYRIDEENDADNLFGIT